MTFSTLKDSALMIQGLLHGSEIIIRKKKGSSETPGTSHFNWLNTGRALDEPPGTMIDALISMSVCVPSMVNGYKQTGTGVLPVIAEI